VVPRLPLDHRAEIDGHRRTRPPGSPCDPSQFTAPGMRPITPPSNLRRSHHGRCTGRSSVIRHRGRAGGGFGAI
jgi:hypothetical protein